MAVLGRPPRENATDAAKSASSLSGCRPRLPRSRRRSLARVEELLLRRLAAFLVLDRLVEELLGLAVAERLVLRVGERDLVGGAALSC